MTYAVVDMTKVQIRFRLARPIDAVLMARISEAQTRYGILRVEVAPSRDAVMVEYDATRLSPADVESTLAAAGIPIAPEMA
jgi:allophanate hydrolase subunit 1